MGYTKLNLFYEALNAFGKEYAMADTKNEIMNEEDQGMLITLEDENGQEVEFEFLDLIPYRQNEYVVLLPIGDSDGQVVILQLKEIDDETEEYVGVENEFVLETVFALFKERNKDFFTFE